MNDDVSLHSIMLSGDGGYRFGTIAYLYSPGPARPGSVLSGFLDFLSGDVGRAELRRAGYLPCVDRPRPLLPLDPGDP